MPLAVKARRKHRPATRRDWFLSMSIYRIPFDYKVRGCAVLTKVSCGTEVNILQEGVPDVIPAEACYLGWQESLILLGKLVEAEIPD